MPHPGFSGRRGYKLKKVELIYESGCPNVLEVRVQLRNAFKEAGAPGQWIEWERSDPDAPAYAKDYGSPTVLVDGKDVAGVSPVKETSCCRLYGDGSGGFQGMPAVSLIVSALRQLDHAGMGHRGGLWGALASGPGALAALVPVGFCPLCLPAYAGLVSSLGIGFVVESRYLLAALIVLLLPALLMLIFRASSRRGYGPFFVGTIGICGIFLGKFYFLNPMVTTIGVAVLVAASLWNAWPQRKDRCPNCSPLENIQ